MNKKIKLLRRVLIIALVVVIGMLIKNLMDRNEGRFVKEYQLNNYIPSGMANVYQSQLYGLDRMWIYRLNGKETKEISDSIKNNNWEKLSESFYHNCLSAYSRHDIEERHETVDFNNTYCIVYDLNSNSYVDIEKIPEMDNRDNNFIIFIYDATNKRFYTTINLMWT